MRESCDKNVIMPLCSEMACWEKAKLVASRAGIFPLSDVGLVKGEILALLTCTCMRVGTWVRPPSVTEIWSQIATGCSCFWQEVRALQPLHKSNLFANWCTKSINRVPYHDDEKVSIYLREKFHIVAFILLYQVGVVPPQHVNNEVGLAHYLGV